MLNITQSIFGKIDGNEILLYTIRNSNGLTCKLTNYGGIITSLHVPDRNDISSEVVLGFDNLESYAKGHPYFGSIIGRIANRISHSRFTIDDVEYLLASNNDAHHLHGGTEGFDKKIWDSHIIKDDGKVKVVMQYLSPDGEENYPGNLNSKITFIFCEDNNIEIEYHCTTDRTTIVNLTHHDYFNLDNGGSDSVLNHELMINANHYTPTNVEVCPLGFISEVENTDYDFRIYKNIGRMINVKDGGIIPGKGYDINYVVDTSSSDPIASLRSTASGRQLDIYSDQPCLQLYTSGHLDGTLSRYTDKYQAYAGVCLESQSFPDSINQSDFPSVILEPGEVYKYKTRYEFSKCI